jgi:ADP-ribose pyrophosphatase YjhB (NUDIX family)
VTSSEEAPDRLPWTRVGAYAICGDQAGRLLACRIAPGFPEAGSWTLPGGGIDHGEHPDAAVLRELAEETGLEGRIDSVAGVVSLVVERPVSRPGRLHAVAIVYRVVVAGTDLIAEIGGSTDACAWLELDALAALPHVDLVDLAIERLRAGTGQTAPGLRGPGPSR